MMKKVTHVLRFLALVFFLFLAIVVCFLLNKALDAKIAASHEEALNNVKATEAPADPFMPDEQ